MFLVKPYPIASVHFTTPLDIVAVALLNVQEPELLEYRPSAAAPDGRMIKNATTEEEYDVFVAYTKTVVGEPVTLKVT